jgi:replicative DNA helicase
MKQLDKLPPNETEIENTIIGAFLIESQSDEAQAQINDLKEDYFYNPVNKEVVLAITQVHSRNEPIDVLTVVNQLKTTGRLDAVGGAYQVSQYTNKVMSSTNIEYHFAILKQAYIKRKIIADCSKMIEDAYDPTSDSILLIDEFEKKTNELTANIIVSKITTSSELLQKALERNKKIKAMDGVVGVTSGLTEIDKITGGWQPSDLIILAARPGMGKTSLALKFLTTPAFQGIPTAIFSLEMSSLQLYSRIISQETDIPLENIIRKGMTTDDEDRLINQFKDMLESANMYFDDTAGISLFELRNKARKLKREKGIKLLVIDYLQLMTAREKKGYNRENEISEISRGLKSIAKELDIPVIALAQLSRAVEQRGGDKIPLLADLRESGSIEQDADAVLFIYRPEYYGLMEDAGGASTRGIAEIHFAKHRNGSLGQATVNFEGEKVKFTDLITRHNFNMPVGEDFYNNEKEEEGNGLPY